MIQYINERDLVP